MFAKNKRADCSLASASPPWAQSAQAGHDGASAVVAVAAVKGGRCVVRGPVRRGLRPKRQSHQPRRRGSPSACRLLRARSCTRPSSRARIGRPRRSASGKSRSQTCPRAAAAMAQARAMPTSWGSPLCGDVLAAALTPRPARPLVTCRAARPQAPALARGARLRCASPRWTRRDRRSWQPPRPHFRPWSPQVRSEPKQQVREALMPQAARPSFASCRTALFPHPSSHGASSTRHRRPAPVARRRRPRRRPPRQNCHRHRRLSRISSAWSERPKLSSERPTPWA